MENWLSLSDYSKDYDVSVSTLRRRIKSGKAEYQFEEGKYLLKNSPLKEHKPNTQVSHHHPKKLTSPAPPQDGQDKIDTPHPERPVTSRDVASLKMGWADAYGKAQTSGKPESRESKSAPDEKIAPSSQAPAQGASETDLVWKSVNGMIDELKKAYSLILQEKEEQILQLKDEHSDLRTLIRVLEEENQRLKDEQATSNSLDEWLGHSQLD